MLLVDIYKIKMTEKINKKRKKFPNNKKKKAGAK